MCIFANKILNIDLISFSTKLSWDGLRYFIVALPEPSI